MDSNEAIDRLAHNMKIAASLIGNDIAGVDPEYTRAMCEFVCYSSGLSGDLAPDIEAILFHYCQS